LQLMLSCKIKLKGGKFAMPCAQFIVL